MGGAGAKQPSLRSDFSPMLLLLFAAYLDQWGSLNASGEDTDKDVFLFCFVFNSGSSDNCPAREERFFSIVRKV